MYSVIISTNQDERHINTSSTVNFDDYRTKSNLFIWSNDLRK